MPNRQLFVNLPVKDLTRSVDFFTKLGFEFNPQFTDENATCMLIGEDAFAMLLTEPFFKGFVTKDLADTSTHIEAILCVTADSREDVDQTLAAALAAGATSAGDLLEDGPMYGARFHDLDGHLWEVLHMDLSAFADAG